MKLKFTNLLWLMAMWLMWDTSAVAQQQTPLDIAKTHLRINHLDWNLTGQDVADYIVSDMYTDDQTGISRVYFLQRHQGIPVYNAILNISMTKDGKVFHTGKRFVQDLAGKVNTTVPVLTPEDAISKALQHLGITNEPLRLKQQVNEQEFIFEKGNLSRENMTVKLRYQNYQNSVLLSWDVFIAPKGGSDMWNMRINAVSGDMLDKNNWTVYCDIGPDTFRHVDSESTNVAEHNHDALTYDFGMVTGAQYNVWPIPFESPNHGPRTLVVDPAAPTASPFGWHDTNGQAGAEFTITRGNNVHAYEDSGNTNASVNNEPDGGADLHFDFTYDAAFEPVQFTNAAVVNLFYMNNIMHDFSYHYGFTEAAGNFQSDNYGNGGAGNDFVRAEAQDGGGTNNANFSTPADGANPRMQMFLWGASGAKHLTVVQPASVAGPYSTGIAGTGWGAGAYASTTPVTAEVVIVDDAVEEPYSSDACQPIVNGSELVGKIAIIDRGGCEFGFKAVAAQNAGALGVIICNFADATIAMGAGAVGANVTIPVVSLSVIDCQTIRQFAGNGLIATIVNPGQTGPTNLDGDLDNGIIAHEYGHGISNRLTGGPSQSGCLSGSEQMGEGWSDFMTLVTTVKQGDTGTKKRGVGTYATSELVTGKGIRAFPYSTDMTISPVTYSDVPAAAVPHGVGAIWTNMIWDMYWAFVDEYGWDADLYNGTGGNNMAIRLVFEGMSTQPCMPGFVDGRDAILAADVALYNGVNKCLIWDVFARRGCGFGADQGTSANVGDEIVSFKSFPACLNAITIEKSVTPLIDAGDDIDVTIKVGNFKAATSTGVVVTDELPAGTSFKAGSSSLPGTVSGNTVSFNLGTMAFLEEKTITYKLTTSPDKFSIRHFLDDVPTEVAEDNWDYYLIGTPNATAIWQIDNTFANSGEWAWFIQDVETVTRAGLELITPWKVTGAQPALRFYHRYDTEPGADGGVVDVKEAGTSTWKQVADKMIRNGYPGFIQYGTFVVPNLQAYSGTSGNEFIGTYVDLSSYAGKDLVMRFRFGTDDNTAGPLGWIVDDVEFMDLFNYNGQACITNNQGDNECAIAPEKGTIVESQLPTNSTVEQLKDVTMAVYPNPANNVLHIALNTEQQQDLSISILTVEGKEVMARATNVYGSQTISVNISTLARGFYFVKLTTKDGILVQKVVIE